MSVARLLSCVRTMIIFITWWRHQMETFSALLVFVRGIHRSPVNSSHEGQWRRALMFSLISVWINNWVNNRKVGDLRRYHTHYDVIVMSVWGQYYSEKLPRYVTLGILKLFEETLTQIQHGARWTMIQEIQLIHQTFLKLAKSREFLQHFNSLTPGRDEVDVILIE